MQAVSSDGGRLTSSKAAISPSRGEEGLLPSASGFGNCAFSCLISPGRVRSVLRILDHQLQEGVCYEEGRAAVSYDLIKTLQQKAEGRMVTSTAVQAIQCRGRSRRGRSW